MEHPTPIVADPISSDGSEESWILLDEMDEAMREEFDGTQNSNETNNDETTATSSGAMKMNESSQSPSPEIEIMAANDDGGGDEDVDDGAIIADEEPSVDYPSNVETMSSGGAISACPSNDDNDDDDDDDDDNINDAEHLRSVLEKNSALQVYDDSNDGSTTDGSISIIGEGEQDHHHQEGTAHDHGFESDELSTNMKTTSASLSAPQPLQMWMRCTPIDMTICAKRPLQPRQYESNRCQRPKSFAELGLFEQSIFVDVLGHLERFNNFLSSIYLLQVFLLFLTAGSVALLAIIYSRYSACKLEVKDLQQKLYSTKMDNWKIEGNLARCEYLYEMELEKTTTDGEFREMQTFETAVDASSPTIHSMAHVPPPPLPPPPPTQSDVQNVDKPEIQPTRRLPENEENVVAGKKLQTVWTGADDNLTPTIKPPYNTKEIHLTAECAEDDGSLFSEYNREYCENQKKNQANKVYATHYSYKAIDDGECNPNKIDFTLGIEHAQKILRETNCDDDGTMKYLQKAYENYQENLKTDDHSMKRQKHQKAQKINSSVIKIDKYNDGDDDSLPEKRLERKEKRNRRGDRKSKRNKDDDDDDDDDDDKENRRQRKSDRKNGGTKRYHQDKDKETGKRIKNDRKRDTVVKVYEHRHHHD